MTHEDQEDDNNHERLADVVHARRAWRAFCLAAFIALAACGLLPLPGDHEE